MLGKKMFPLFALALDLPEGFFDDKVCLFCIFYYAVYSYERADEGSGSNYACSALSSTIWPP